MLLLLTPTPSHLPITSSAGYHGSRPCFDLSQDRLWLCGLYWFLSSANACKLQAFLSADAGLIRDITQLPIFLILSDTPFSGWLPTCQFNVCSLSYQTVLLALLHTKGLLYFLCLWFLSLVFGPGPLGCPTYTIFYASPVEPAASVPLRVSANLFLFSVSKEPENLPFSNSRSDPLCETVFLSWVGITFTKGADRILNCSVSIALLHSKNDYVAANVVRNVVLRYICYK